MWLWFVISSTVTFNVVIMKFLPWIVKCEELSCCKWVDIGWLSALVNLYFDSREILVHSLNWDPTTCCLCPQCLFYSLFGHEIVWYGMWLTITCCLELLLCCIYLVFAWILDHQVAGELTALLNILLFALIRNSIPLIPFWMLW